MSAGVDVLVICALKDELDALLEVRDGLLEAWTLVPGDPEHWIASYRGIDGHPLRFAAAHATEMGGVAAMAVLSPLADRLSPRALAMCGVCAGHPDDSDLGDVVIADRVFEHDRGKLTVDGFQGDLWTRIADDRWRRAAQALAGPAVGLAGYTEPDAGARRWWFLERLFNGRRPLKSVALRRYVADSERRAFLTELIDERGYVTRTGRELALTDAGRDAVDEYLTYDGTLVTARPYHVLLGPIGSGNSVIADGEARRSSSAGPARVPARQHHRPQNPHEVPHPDSARTSGSTTTT